MESSGHREFLDLISNDRALIGDSWLGKETFKINGCWLYSGKLHVANWYELRTNNIIYKELFKWQT